MTTSEIDQLVHVSQNSSPPFLDQLYCEETFWNDDDDDDDEKEDDCCSFEDEDDQLVALLLKEEKTHINECAYGGNKSLIEARTQALEWIIRVSPHYDFSATTVILAVNYFDRFMSRVGFQEERVWITQLAAVACLSLASKFQETHVPTLSELQGQCRHIFDPKTIQRMELLVLSELKWKMNVVTPLSYFGHLIRRFKLKNRLHWEVLCRCEALILSAIADPRIFYYVPSVVAVATMVHTMRELRLWNPTDHQIHLIDAFRVKKDKIEECYKVIQDISKSDIAQKRKCTVSGDSSPKTVLGVVFTESCKESSISLLSLPEPLPKRCRTVESLSG